MFGLLACAPTNTHAHVEVLIGVALAFGLATYGRAKDHNSDIKLGKARGRGA